MVQPTPAFLNCTLKSEQLDLLCKNLSFESMKNDTSVTFEDLLVNLPARSTTFEGKIEIFTGKGEVGSWKCFLTPKLELKLNLYTQNNLKDNSYIFSI